MKTPLRVLIVEDSESDAELLIRLLNRAQYDPVCQQVQTEEEMSEALNTSKWDIVLSDYSLPQFDALAALRILQSTGIDIPFIVVSGAIGEDTAVAIMKAGAHDYLMKNNMNRLIPAIERELREAEVRQEKRNSQNALAESVEQYRFLFNHMAQGVIYHDNQGQIVSANHAAEQILGLSEEQMLGLKGTAPNWKAIHEGGSDFPGDTHPAMMALKTGQEVRDTVIGVFNPEAGAYRWLSVNAVPQFKKGEASPYQVFVTFDDITALKKSEQSLRESEHLLKKAQQIAHIGHWRLNTGANVIDGSDELFRIFGLRREDPFVKSFVNVIHPDDRDFVFNTFRNSFNGPIGFDIESRLICIDNLHKWIRSIGEPVLDPQGNAVAMVGTVQDITERKRAEQKHLKMEEQLRQAQKMEAVGHLAGGVAHDFNNLLFVISGYVEMIMDDLTPGSEIYEQMEHIMKSVQKSATLVRQLLLFSRKEAMQPKIIDSNQLIGNLLKMLRRVIGENIHLEVRPGFSLKPIYADPGQIEQVLMNLCVNSRDAMPEGGRIVIETENISIGKEFCQQHPWSKEGDYVLLTVSDTGCGIPHEIQDLIFDPFFTTKEVGKGTGLGLAAVYGIVKSHNGMIHLYSESGLGTTFKIYIPSAEKAVSVSEDEKALPKSKPGKNETILIAEDEDDVRRIIITILETAGYRVISARDGEEAIQLFQNHSEDIRLALLDVVMPNAGGLKVLEQIKIVKPNLPVIFLTGYSKGMLPSNISPDSRYEVIQKPVFRSVLLHKMKAVFDT